MINGRWFHDNATLKVHKGEKGTNKVWDIAVDELTGLPWTGIYNKKNKFIGSMCQFIQAWKSRGCPVLIIGQDNAGENKKLEQRLHIADWKLQVKMEHAATDTPQQNALVELQITYLVAKARAAMHASGVPRERRLKIFLR